LKGASNRRSLTKNYSKISCKSYKDENDIVEPGWQVVDKDLSHWDDCVEQKEQEEFSVVESDAIIQPGAVVIHIKHASVASWAVVTSLRLENVANQTVSSSLVVWVIQEKALLRDLRNWRYWGLLPRKEELCQDR